MWLRIGALPLPVVTLLARIAMEGSFVAGEKGLNLAGNTPGFELPEDLGDLGASVTTLRLKNCSLIGNCDQSLDVW